MARMRVSVRREEILRILDEQAEVTVKGLASHFGVSTVTIRTDLDALRSRGALRRLHGGAKLLRAGALGHGRSERCRKAPVGHGALRRNSR